MGGENNRTVWHPAYLLTNQAEGSRQVQLHGYPEKMQEGARLRHARQGNQSSHIVSAVLSFTQRANMAVTLRNHLWRVYLTSNFTAASQDSQHIKLGAKCDFLKPYLKMSRHFVPFLPLQQWDITKCKTVCGVVVFLKGKKREWEIRRYQSAAFSHIFQSLQNLCQAGVIRVHKPYRRRGWIRFL